MALEQLIAAAGLKGLFAGAVLEGDTVALLAGVLAHRGLFPFEAAALAITAGAVAVDNLFYAVGRFAGQGGWPARLLAKPPVARLRARLAAHGTLVVLGFRFLYGMKTAGAVLIGASGIGWARFAALDALACLVWAHLLAALGYLAGGAIARLFGDLPLHHHLGIAILGIALAAFGMHLALRRR